MAELARMAGQALVFLLLALGLGYLSQRPLLRPLPEGEALVRLAMAVPGKLKGECRRLTEQELAKLPPNMRRPEDCPRARLPVPFPKAQPGQEGPATLEWKSGAVEIRVPGAVRIAFFLQYRTKIDHLRGTVIKLDP